MEQKMQVYFHLVNQTGEQEIRDFLREYSTLGELTPDMLSAWCAQAEDSGCAMIELRAHQSRDRTVRTLTLSPSGYDVHSFDATDD